MSLGGWAEEKHPRDQRGRFSSGGEGPPAGAVGKWASQKTEPISAGRSPARNWTDKLPSGAKDESWKEHYNAHPDAGGKPSAEREKLHDAIKKEFLNVPTREKGDTDKIAIVTMGAPASGKSSAVRAFQGEQDFSKFVKVDPDAIKEKLPEYSKFMDPKNTYRGAAAYVHEESSALAKGILKEAIAKGHHIILDGTGADAEKYVGKLQALKDAGYHVHVIFPHIPVEEGRKRRDARAEHTGRFVPDRILESAYKSIPGNMSKIAKAADSFRMYDNSGKGPRLVYEKDHTGKETEHDPSYMKDFREKHPQNG
jgi:predicted ABC-type ATPase